MNLYIVVYGRHPDQQIAFFAADSKAEVVSMFAADKRFHIDCTFGGTLELCGMGAAEQRHRLKAIEKFGPGGDSSLGPVCVAGQDCKRNAFRPNDCRVQLLCEAHPDTQRGEVVPERTHFCFDCAVLRTCHIDDVTETLKVHGEAITLTNAVMVCDVCDKQVDDGELADKATKAFADEYARRHNENTSLPAPSAQSGDCADIP